MARGHASQPRRRIPRRPGGGAAHGGEAGRWLDHQHRVDPELRRHQIALDLRGLEGGGGEPHQVDGARARAGQDSRQRDRAGILFDRVERCVPGQRGRQAPAVAGAGGPRRPAAGARRAAAPAGLGCGRVHDGKRHRRRRRPPACSGMTAMELWARLKQEDMRHERPELRKRSANFVTLSPVSFLNRAAEFFGDRLAVVHGSRRFTYSEFYARAKRLAHALTKAGIKRGDTVAILAANTPAMLEAHYAVPMIGAVLNPINVRLDAPLIAFCLEHGEAKLLLADREFHATVAPALERLGSRQPIVVDIADVETEDAPTFGNVEYEDFIASGEEDFAYSGAEDE